MTARGAARTAVSGLGQLLVTAGVVLLLFCVYELEVTGVTTARAQAHLSDDLDRSFAAPPAAAPVAPAAPDLGDAYARLHLPVGRTRSVVVVEGVGTADLRRGPGHLPGSAAPGEVGNLVVSGHRTTYGAPFRDLDELAPGDPVVVETARGWSTYRVTGSEVVAPSAVEVTEPVPGRPGETATSAVLTLTTCTPAYSARQRLVVHALLASTVPRAAGPPPGV